MRGFARSAYGVMLWLFVVGVVTQFVLAGLALFDSGLIWETHVGVGYTVGNVLLLNVIFGLLGKLPRAAWGRLGLLFLIYVIQTMLPGLRDSVPWISALHPINAAAILWLSVAFARHARQYAPRPVGVMEPEIASVQAPEAAKPEIA
jgi:hypothetical protein